MTQPNPGCEEAVERLRIECGPSPSISGLKFDVSVCAEDLALLLADRDRLAGELEKAIEVIRPFARMWDQVDEDDRVRRAWIVTVKTTSDAIRRAVVFMKCVPTKTDGE